MKCQEHPEGGLRHEFIYCHCDMDKAAALERAREELIEAVRSHACSCYIGDITGTRQKVVDKLAALDKLEGK